MALTPSTMIPLGTICPSFSLTDVTTNAMVRTADFLGKPLLVMFICNHCPFVIHIQEELARVGDDFPTRGVCVLGVCSNDARAYPEDAPDKMVAMARAHGWNFPYLHDATQSVAHAFHAACTPDFFLFDASHRLVYRGQLDESRPHSGSHATGRDLRHAVDALLAGEPPLSDQRPSMGCNVKWHTTPAH
ncbi:MAG: thioredoxin family protein [Phycisphaerales bacterium]|nr:thioredoxin family protein [Phycisphaerales bacterium]